jgi:hypothetical protein
MPFYTANNVDLTLNGTGYYVSNVSLSSSVNINPVKKIGSILSDEYTSDGTVNGSLNFSYFLTGEDPIKNLMINDSPVSGNFCGLFFDSGYMTEYSLAFNANQPASISASFSFFGKMSGSFAKRSSSLGDIETLNISNFRFNETGVVNGEKILSLSYRYNSSIQPYYSVQETSENPVPHRVGILNKTVSMQASTNDYSISLPSTGLRCKALMSMKDSNDVEKESYSISGVINSNTNEVSAGDMLVKNLSMTQSNLAIEPPTIDNIQPSSGATGSHVVLSGSNLSSIESVNLKGYELPFDTPTGATGVGVSIPTGIPQGSIFGGPIEIRTQGGLGLSTGTFVVS